jgi:hypothetical protein
VYIEQTQRILSGQRPYLDFFQHQTPLHLYTLAALVWPAPDSVFLYRLVSLLATAATGFVVSRVARALASPAAGLFALALFFAAPVQFYGLLALPNACMGLCSALGVYGACFGRKPVSAALGGVALVAAVLYKPLALPVAIAVAVALACSRDRWVRGAAGAAAGLAVGLLAWAVLDAASDGAFSELLEMQRARFSGKSGFELMRGYAPFAAEATRRGVSSAVGWNAVEHANSLRPWAVEGHGLLVLLAVVGLGRLARHVAAPLAQRVVVALWFFVPLGFSLFYWEPAWDHYFVQYAAPLAVLAALPLAALWRARRARAPARITAVALVAAALAQGALHLSLRQRDYAALPRPAVAGEPWLTFDPFLNLATHTLPACGLIDPFNVYGPHSLAATGASFARQRVSSQQLVECLRRDPQIRIYRGTWFEWFEDPTLRAELDALPASRFVGTGQR